MKWNNFYFTVFHVQNLCLEIYRFLPDYLFFLSIATLWTTLLSLQPQLFFILIPYFIKSWHLNRAVIWRADSLEKTLMLGRIEDRGEGDDRGQNGWMASPTWWRWVWASFRRWWRTGKPSMLQSLGVAKSQTWLSDWMIVILVKNLPANAGYLGSIPWVGKIPYRRKWNTTPVFLPGKSHGQRSLVGDSPRGCKESDMT